ncbi:hypothetical protein SCLARK_001426 [Spiroplasma clarkii]|uniref:hypothetical protein n=1 Tax=Spiroplasma clarkii TaxID=2139 RepID=UPI000B56B7D3|nr:hypothetical protein [Spiroplasma clarkii]ARU91949.1 hypothetical protein SCLARK_001426 [Spiroplasma clarkii]
MTNQILIFIASFSGFLAVVLILIWVLVLIIKKKQQKRKASFAIAGITSENNSTKKAKWWISAAGELEKLWMNGQVDDYQMRFFGYQENFAIGFFHSNFVNTNKFIFDKTSYASSKQIMANLKKYNNILENLWWNKYKKIAQTCYAKIFKLTNEPEYFFTNTFSFLCEKCAIFFPIMV